MAGAQAGDTVSVHYTGRLEDGTVFDSSRGREPLTFTVGEGQVIEGFDEAVRGLEPGASTSVEIAPEQGYGSRREDMVLEVSLEEMPGIEPHVGLELQLHLESGQQIPVRVTEVSGESVTLDANHPLAGKTLHFDIERVGPDA